LPDQYGFETGWKKLFHAIGVQVSINWFAGGILSTIKERRMEMINGDDQRANRFSDLYL
jgi:hypothetical protein